MKIGDLDFHEALCLAPMAGVSDIGLRQLASEEGADATWSEMLSARAMLHNPKKTELMTMTSEAEKVKVGQIFGHEPVVMARVVNNPLLSHYDVIDINMGCPAPKIVRNGEGSALMRDLPLAGEIIRACVRASSRPVSVKFRLGYERDISREFGRMCEDAGASFITLHARTTEQGYSGRADLEAIARLKASVSIPVIGNGDVVDIESYHNMKNTGVNGIMIGRGVQGKPWIFNILKGGEKPKDIYAVVEKHVNILRQHYNEEFLVLYMRKHFLWYICDIPYASEMRLKIATSPSIDDSLKILKDILK